MAVTIFLAACDMLDMPKKMDALSNQMSQTNQGVHDQTLKVALDGLLDPANTIVPDNPASMPPYGQKFADNASADEIAQLFQSWIVDINLNQPDGSTVVNGAQDPNAASKLEHSKFAKYTAMQVIAGLASQAKIQQLIREQISGGGGYYEQAAMSALLMRANFIRSYLFEEGYHNVGVINLSQLAKEVTLAQYVEYIVNLPYASSLAIDLKMLTRPDSVHIKLDPMLAAGMWSEIHDDEVSLQSNLKSPRDLAQLNSTMKATNLQLSKYCKNGTEEWKQKNQDICTLVQ